jgi:replication factor A1
MKVDEIVNIIVEKTGISKEEIEKRITEKRKELSNLISEEGAAHIIAKEFGINLIKRKIHTLKIKNIISGMRNVNIVARVLNKTDIYNFKRSDGTEGKVASLHIGDETGVIRVVLWDDETDIIPKLERNDIIRINNAYTRENLDNVEVMLGKRGTIIKTDEKLDIPSSGEIEAKFDYTRKTREYEDMNIIKLKNGISAKLRACVVQLFKIQPLFFTCPVCGARLEYNEDCKEHGKSSANLVISGVIDDGTGNIRFVAFRDIAEKILNKTTDEILNFLKGNDGKDIDFNKIFENANLGKDFIFLGYTKVNPLFDRLEFIVNDIKEVDITKEAEKILEEINKEKQIFDT